MERFCKKYPDSVKQRDPRGRSALVHAALTDNVKNAQFLIRYEFQPGSIHKIPCSQLRPGTNSQFRKGLSFWDVDNNDATVMHYAVHASSVKMIKMILQSGNPPKVCWLINSGNIANLFKLLDEKLSHFFIYLI